MSENKNFEEIYELDNLKFDEHSNNPNSKKEKKYEKAIEDLQLEMQEIKESIENHESSLVKFKNQNYKVDNMENRIENIYGQFITILITLFAVAFMSVSLYSLIITIIPSVIKGRYIDFTTMIIGIGVLICSATLMIQGMIYFLFAAYRQFIMLDNDFEFKILHPTSIIFIGNIILELGLILLLALATL